MSVLLVSHVGYEKAVEEEEKGNQKGEGHTRVGYHPLPCLNGASVASHFFHMIASGRTSFRSAPSTSEEG